MGRYLSEQIASGTSWFLYLKASLVLVFYGPIYTILWICINRLFMCIFSSHPFLSFFFLFPKHTVASEFLSMQTAIKLSIKKKGSSFSFTDAQYLN